MRKLLPAFPLAVSFFAAMVLLGCGSNARSLQSVTVSPATAHSQAQFTATGAYNNSAATVDITQSTTWCVGGSDGICAGNIAIEASVNAGLAQCLQGFSGTVTVLAGQPVGPAMADVGFQLKPFGMAQLICP